MLSKDGRPRDDLLAYVALMSTRHIGGTQVNDRSQTLTVAVQSVKCSSDANEIGDALDRDIREARERSEAGDKSR